SGGPGPAWHRHQAVLSVARAWRRGWALTIHSSRNRFAVRLNSGVRRQETGMDFLKRRAAHSSSSLAKGIGAGLGFGAAIGLIIGNVALGIAIGVALGAAIGARRGSHSSDEQGS